MKKLMKLAVVFLALVMILSVAACGDSVGDNSGAAAPSGNSQDSGGSEDNGGSGNNGGSGASGDFGSCADVYNFYEKLTDKMSDTMEELIDAHNEKEGVDYIILLYMPFSSLRYLDASSFDADTTASTMEAAYKALGNEDASVTQDGNLITITYTGKNYTTGDTYAFKEEIRYDTSGPSLSVVNYHDGELSSFNVFQALGGDNYALSTEYERAIVTYRDGEIVAIDHAVNIWDYDSDVDGYTEDSVLFDFDSGNIFGGTADSAWVHASEGNGLYRHYELKDGSCRITGLNETTDWESGVTTYSDGYDVTIP